MGNNQKPCFCQREMQHLVICYLLLVFFRYLLVFSIKRKKNPEVATFTCGGYERGSSQLKHLLVSVFQFSILYDQFGI